MRPAGVTAQGRWATDRLLTAVAERLAQGGICLVGALRPAAATPWPQLTTAPRGVCPTAPEGPCEVVPDIILTEPRSVLSRKASA